MTTRRIICWPSLKAPNPEALHLHKRGVVIPVVLPRLDHISPTPPPETGPGIAAGPHPEPWILGQDLSQETQFRLQVLASIHALAQHLDHGVRERFQGLAMDSVGKLPADMEISVHDFRD